MAARSAMGFAASALRQAGAQGARAAAPVVVPRAMGQHIRHMGGHGHGVTHGGLTLHEPGMWHKAAGYGFGGLMWFWIFLRFYRDGDTLIYGHAPHFQDDHDDDHH
mmetsp:Transcript_41054/g.101280  ORF Transcript_41054/g.101280 Transcript_41054/m.101280 type:complete len:106 (+) Transcript_41054:81-398(+)